MAKRKAKKTAKKSWRGERSKGKKYSGGDRGRRPSAGTRKRYWRSGYRRKDGSRVKGHYVTNPKYRTFKPGPPDGPPGGPPPPPPPGD